MRSQSRVTDQRDTIATFVASRQLPDDRLSLTYSTSEFAIGEVNDAAECHRFFEYIWTIMREGMVKLINVHGWSRFGLYDKLVGELEDRP